ncbi:glycosyltransferase [Sphingobacterium sp. UT-1RO-CII-1]|uniref:glycosyltransferase n=1 Tax=Sphingobacterium sp. UT-1RO-CII-1 TaxID=2995225 RepID=UPI00227CAF36|nr:glycosyltransferase [Sphingobacterium sp. UT-1RO-CII-1]MCY4778224.1 glycosyltransferase [Sphingobacterium sp. UT-1RO-CII-1]
MTDIEFITRYIPFALLGVFLVIQLYYIIYIYGRLAFHRVKAFSSKNFQPPVSVVICAYNEEANLSAFLPSILNQNYPNYQVVVVNDCSTDETPWVLKEFTEQYPDKLKIVEIKEHIQLKHTKKFALTLGIKAAQHEHLVFTDADCQPNSENWLSEMAGAFAFNKGKQIILGYSPYLRKGGFLNSLIRFETTHTAISYLSYALKGDAYMGVGRNLAYTKSLFFKGKGFNKHMHIKSGDDDLFVNHNATKDNVAVVINLESQVYSVPKDTWKSYYKQKARHSGASVLYKKRHKKMLATQLISAMLFYLMIVLCLTLFPNLWFIPLCIYLIRYLGQLIIFAKIYKKLQVIDLLIWLPFLDIFYYFYICFNGLFNRNSKKTTWS